MYMSLLRAIFRCVFTRTVLAWKGESDTFKAKKKNKPHLKSNKSLCKQSWRLGNTADESIHLWLHLTVSTDGSEMCHALHNPNINKKLMRCHSNGSWVAALRRIYHTHTHKESCILWEVVGEATSGARLGRGGLSLGTRSSRVLGVGPWICLARCPAWQHCSSPQM